MAKSAKDPAKYRACHRKRRQPGSGRSRNASPRRISLAGGTAWVGLTRRLSGRASSRSTPEHFDPLPNIEQNGVPTFPRFSILTTTADFISETLRRDVPTVAEEYRILSDRCHFSSLPSLIPY